MIEGFKPNLAADCKGDLDRIVFPLWASPKIDGIRCVLHEGHAWSRSLKHIPNGFVQTYLAEVSAQCGVLLDGELCVGNPYDKNLMQQTTSGVMRRDGVPDFTFWLFDAYDPDDPTCTYEYRRGYLADWYENCSDDMRKRIKLVPQLYVSSGVALAEYEDRTLAEGFEGIMVRSPQGIYKFGRSTLREQGLTKVKRFSDAEAVVIGVQEEMHNGNEAKTDALGRTERSSHQGNLVGKGRLGALVCKVVSGEFAGATVNIGTGFTADQREAFWTAHMADGYLTNKIVKFKYFAHGCVDAPRHPVFIGFRAPEDM